MAVIKRIIGVLATGYILMFFSENLFWARIRPDDNLSGWMMTWIAYSILAYIFIRLISYFNVKSIWGVLLCGAVFGWLAEGVIVQTMYEDLPLSISFTGLGWHSLVSVCIGWYGLRLVFRQSITRAMIMTCLIGLVYGFWAVSWWTEPGEVPQYPINFAMFSTVIAVLLILSYWLTDRTIELPLKSHWSLDLLIGIMTFLYFVFIAIPIAKWAAIILPILLAIVALALLRMKMIDRKITLNLFPGNTPNAVRYLTILLIPLISSLIYSTIFSAGWRLHTNWIMYLVVTPAGFILFLYSLYFHFFTKIKTIATEITII